MGHRITPWARHQDARIPLHSQTLPGLHITSGERRGSVRGNYHGGAGDWRGPRSARKKQKAFKCFAAFINTSKLLLSGRGGESCTCKETDCSSTGLSGSCLTLPRSQTNHLINPQEKDESWGCKPKKRSYFTELPPNARRKSHPNLLIYTPMFLIK